MGLNENLYRKHRDRIREKAAEGNSRFLELGRDRILIHMFGIPPECSKLVTAQEWEDIKNFAQYANLRLETASIVSPINYHTARRELDVPLLLNSGLPHDLLHASWQGYVTESASQGKRRSFRPEFTNVAHKSYQWWDEGAFQEELGANLFDTPGDNNGTNFLDFLIRGGEINNDDFRDYSDQDRKAIEKCIGEYKKYTERIKHLKKTDPKLYTRLAYERFTLARIKATVLINGITNAEFSILDAKMKQIQDNPTPQYLYIFDALYENAHSKHPDPLIKLRLWQAMLKPTLTRLRKSQPENEIKKAA